MRAVEEMHTSKLVLYHLHHYQAVKTCGCLSLVANFASALMKVSHHRDTEGGEERLTLFEIGSGAGGALGRGAGLFLCDQQTCQ